MHIEERLTVSQSVNQSGQQSVGQLVRQVGRQTQTHSLGFLFSGRLGFKQRREELLRDKQWSSGEAVRTPVGGSIMVGHGYWMPPPRLFQPVFQVFVSNELLCYIKSLWYNLACT